MLPTITLTLSMPGSSATTVQALTGCRRVLARSAARAIRQYAAARRVSVWAIDYTVSVAAA